MDIQRYPLHIHKTASLTSQATPANKYLNCSIYMCNIFFTQKPRNVSRYYRRPISPEIKVKETFHSGCAWTSNLRLLKPLRYHWATGAQYNVVNWKQKDYFSGIYCPEKCQRSGLLDIQWISYGNQDGYPYVHHGINCAHWVVWTFISNWHIF